MRCDCGASAMSDTQWGSRSQHHTLMHNAQADVLACKPDSDRLHILTEYPIKILHTWDTIVRLHTFVPGSEAFYALQTVVQDLFCFKHVLPEHQGRAAENILFSVLVAPRVQEAAAAGSDAKVYVPNNVHFDTTEANVLRCGGVPVNLVVSRGPGFTGCLGEWIGTQGWESTFK